MTVDQTRASDFPLRVIVRGVWLDDKKRGDRGWLEAQLRNRASHRIRICGRTFPILELRRVRIREMLEQLPSYHLLRVPDGDLFGGIARLFAEFGGRHLPEPIDIIEPEFELQLNKISTKLGKNFDLARTGCSHSAYLKALKVPSGGSINGKGVSVAVVDTGAEQSTITKTFHDLYDASNTNNVDNHGHGSAMVAIIHDVAKGADIHAIRISDTEWLRLWDIIAGISTAAYEATVKADIINLSLGCMSLAGTCPACGTSAANRPTVFENFLKNIGGKGGALADPVFVCAVGNDDASKSAATSFEWPAQYQCTLAVGAINDNKKKSSFSKTGTTKNDYFMCPGGDFDTAKMDLSEWVGEGDDNGAVTKCAGTSPAAAYAYASGVLALYRQKFLKDVSGGNVSSRDLLDGAVHRCVNDVSGYSKKDHGHGRLIYDDSNSYPP